MDDDAQQDNGQNRRAVLRAGVIGAAWVVPAVTLIGVSPAHADNPSGGQQPPKPEVPVKPEAPVRPESPGQPSSGTPSATTPQPPLKQSSTQGRAVVTAGTTTAEGAQAGELARTGSDIGVAAALGAGLLVGGAAVVAASRKLEANEGPTA